MSVNGVNGTNGMTGKTVKELYNYIGKMVYYTTKEGFTLSCWIEDVQITSSGVRFLLKSSNFSGEAWVDAKDVDLGGAKQLRGKGGENAK